MPRSKTALRDLVRTDRQLRRALLGRTGPGTSHPPDLECRPIGIALAGSDERGCLVMARNRLVAVLAHVREAPGQHDPELAAIAGNWVLEAGFGRCAAAFPPLFGTLAEALAWVRRQVELDAVGTAEALRAAFAHARWLHQDTDRLLSETRRALGAADRLLTELEGDPSPPPPLPEPHGSEGRDPQLDPQRDPLEPSPTG